MISANRFISVSSGECAIPALEGMPSLAREYRGYRIAIYSPISHFAVITPLGSNRIIDLGDRQPRATGVEGPLVCLDRAKAVVDGRVAKSAASASDQI